VSTVKAKPRKAVLARFKLTGSGKLLRRRKGRKHLLSKKRSKTKRFLQTPAVVTEAHASLYTRMMKGV
jgi:large subunit ribosomal protein L35